MELQSINPNRITPLKSRPNQKGRAKTEEKMLPRLIFDLTTSGRNFAAAGNHRARRRRRETEGGGLAFEEGR